MIVTGTAGSGKGYLIKCVVRSITELFSIKQGSASSLSHSKQCQSNFRSNVVKLFFFQMPTGSKSAKEITPTVRNKVQSKCDGNTGIICWWTILCGLFYLGWMEYDGMCRYGMNSDFQLLFIMGSLPVVLFLVDDIQLPPVCCPSVYNYNSNKPLPFRNVLFGRNFQTTVTLSRIIRQNEKDTHLKNILWWHCKIIVCPPNKLIYFKLFNGIIKKESWSKVKSLQTFQWNSLKHGQCLLDRMT